MKSCDENLLEFYRDHVTRILLPFWMDRALDERNGGVYTCFDNVEPKLISKDKYTWSQGRFVWVLSKLASLCRNGMLIGDAEKYLTHAESTVRFLREHAILENGNCAFLLTETGEKIESSPGEGFDSSFYADCFVVLGFSEFSRVSGDVETLELALRLYDRIVRRLNSGSVRSEPYPVNENFRAHAVPMIMLNVSQELRRALDRHNHSRTEELGNSALQYMATLMETFVDREGVVREMVPASSAKGSVEDTLLARHVNPGHTFECMWFVLDEAITQGAHEYLESAARVIEKAMELGWDKEYGGLLRFVDCEGGFPRGRELGDRYERLILQTWDTKLWWPHSEALYCSLRMQELSSQQRFRDMYERLHTYVFQTFPNLDSDVGEWIQIRDRKGEPVDKVVALPVKDPYHTLRNALLTIELLHRGSE